MPFEWFVALRYLREGRSQTALILGAVAVGVAVVIFLSGLIGGLQASLVDKTLGAQAHIVAHPADQAARVLIPERAGQVLLVRVEKPSQRIQSISGWQGIVAQVKQIPGVLAVAPVVSGGVFVVRGAATRSIALRGIEPESYQRIIGLAEKIRAGRYQLVGTEAMLGVDLMSDLGLALGDKVRIVTATGIGDVFTVAGVFDLGSKDINLRLVFVPLRPAQTLFELLGGVSSLEIKVLDIFGAEAVAQEVASRTGLVADSWTRTNAQLLVALKAQGSSKNVILFFITLTVALGIASVLIVSVVQKSREIGILRAVGTPRARVLRIFLIQGGLLGLAGSILGAGLGALLSLAFAHLSRNADGSPMFPVPITLGLCASAAILATAVGLLAAVAPARRAAHLDPAEAIRHG